MKILVIHGPNLHLLGEREVGIYGKTTLKEIDEAIQKESADLGFDVTTQQFNSEGEIVDAIGSAQKNGFSGIVINPAAYTHTSVATLDAIKAISLPVIEVHLSNIHSREEFRQKSITAAGAVGQISGFGLQSYLLALKAMKEHLSEK